MSDGLTDHFTMAETASAMIDDRVKNRSAPADTMLVLGVQGIVHGLLAVADQLDGIRELIETATVPAETVQEYPWTKMDVRMRDQNVDQGRMTADEPYPGP